MDQSSTPFYALTQDDALSRLEADPRGLSEAEAARRLEVVGPNAIAAGRQISVLRVLLHQLASPLIYILLVAMAVTLAIGHWPDAAVIGIVVLVNTVVGFTQEYRAENALQALLGLAAPRATARRGGREREIDSKDLVPGDIVLLTSGDIVPADLRLIAASRLQAAEALLTGESLPVSKTAEALASREPVPLGDQRCMAFMGTSIASGRGVGVVVATARQTQIGAIAREIQTTQRAETPLQRRMGQLGKWISVAVLGLSAVVFAVGLAQGETLTDMFLAAVAIAVSAIPEGLPVVMTIALAVGVRRMARRNAIVRRLPAVETLGSTTVILTDKTGTLTQNVMAVQTVWAAGRRHDVSGDAKDLDGAVTRNGAPAPLTEGDALHLTLLTGALATEATLVQDGPTVEATGDPTETALLVSAAKAGLSGQALRDRYHKRSEVPFESERQFSAAVYEADEKLHTFVKGAPERVLAMCDSWLSEDGPQAIDRPALLVEAQGLAREGLRVLAMAVSDEQEAVEAVERGDTPVGLTFVGLQGMMDPPRPEVVQAVADCRRAGIRVVMVTGDHATTAATIAHMVGLTDEARPRVVTGSELEGMTDAELDREVRRVQVFSRASPAQKLRLVQALRQQGEVVAVTGDGVNDAPALKAGHIGAAMGRSGTDVAKEASEMVLTDDNFATVYAAVEEGRFAFSNIRKATFFLLSSGVGFLIAILTSLALRMPLPFTPAQILWLNVVTNGLEDVALAFEPGEKGLLRRPPRSPREGILSRTLLERIAVVGPVLAAGTLFIFTVEMDRGADLAYAQVAALTTMVMFQIFHVGNCRSEDLSAFRKSPFSNPFLFIGTAGSLALHVGAMHFPPTQFLLNLEPLSLETWGRIVPVALSVILAVEAHKLLRRPVGRPLSSFRA